MKPVRKNNRHSQFPDGSYFPHLTNGRYLKVIKVESSTSLDVPFEVALPGINENVGNGQTRGFRS